jgi:hypothetical protein
MPDEVTKQAAENVVSHVVAAIDKASTPEGLVECARAVVLLGDEGLRQRVMARLADASVVGAITSAHARDLAEAFDLVRRPFPPAAP